MHFKLSFIPLDYVIMFHLDICLRNLVFFKMCDIDWITLEKSKRGYLTQKSRLCMNSDQMRSDQ